MKQRLLNLAIALDQFMYVLVTLGKGMPDETMSAAAYRAHRLGLPWGFMHKVIDTLLWFDTNHCQKAYESERLR